MKPKTYLDDNLVVIWRPPTDTLNKSIEVKPFLFMMNLIILPILKLLYFMNRVGTDGPAPSFFCFILVDIYLKLEKPDLEIKMEANRARLFLSIKFN